MSYQRLRGIVAALLVIGLPLAGLLLPLGSGTLSAFGIDAIAVLCPLGALEAMLGSRSVALHGLVCLSLAIILVIVLGKAFCSWACPIPWLQRFFSPRAKGTGRSHKAPHSRTAAAGRSSAAASRNAELVVCKNTNVNEASRATCQPLESVGGRRDGLSVDGRHIVLAGALGTSALFGFPVFCLACPVGLTFATIIGLWRLFSINEASWGLLIFPAVLLLEVLVLRKWCKRICPISALLSILSSLNRTLRPSVAREKCLRHQGIDCRICTDACPEEVDPHSSFTPECSKCHICADRCPAQAITFPLRGKQAPENPAENPQIAIDLEDAPRAVR